jgi:hypothetical protein
VKSLNSTAAILKPSQDLGRRKGSACQHKNQQEFPAMQNVSIQKASELPKAMKSAVEQLLGRPIAPDEEISVAAVPPHLKAGPQSHGIWKRSSTAVRPKLTVFRKRKWMRRSMKPSTLCGTTVHEDRS